MTEPEVERGKEVVVAAAILLCLWYQRGSSGIRTGPTQVVGAGYGSHRSAEYNTGISAGLCGVGKGRLVFSFARSDSTAGVAASNVVKLGPGFR